MSELASESEKEPTRSAGRAERGRALSRGRRRDRWVYLRSHPVLFGLLAMTRRAPVRRLGGTLLVHGTDAYRQVLTRLPLDRRAAGTTGAAAAALSDGDLLFDQQGGEHRAARRQVAADLGAAGLRRLRPVWCEVLDRRLAPLRVDGAPVDMVDLALELAGATAANLLGSSADPRELARAARAAAAATIRSHLPGLPRRGAETAARAAADRLARLAGTGRDAMLAVAAVNTTVAALPRAVAWCADDELWDAAADPDRCDALVSELLRVTAPAPLLPRAAAVAGVVAGTRVPAGRRLILVTRHAVGAHRRDPDPADPAPPALAQLVFGAGAHACPGAALARTQLADTLRALAPLRPVVVRARADRRAALPGWASLVIQCSR